MRHRVSLLAILYSRQPVRRHRQPDGLQPSQDQCDDPGPRRHIHDRLTERGPIQQGIMLGAKQTELLMQHFFDKHPGHLRIELVTRMGDDLPNRLTL